jgi:hypothetical protein
VTARALAEYDGYERRHRSSGCRDELAGRRRALPAVARADHGSGGVDRRLAVLYPASVRGHLLVPRRGRSFHEAALHGSSCYHLPGVLRWFTANIGVLHSITSAVGFLAIGYQKCCGIIRNSLPSDDSPLLQSLRCARLALWGEDGRRLIWFEEPAMGAPSVK